MLAVIAKIKAKQGEADKLAEVFKDMVEWVTENEAGTLTYICNRSTKDSDQFVFFERYAGQKDFEAHSASERFVQLATEIQGLVDGPVDIEIFDQIAAKL